MLTSSKIDKTYFRPSEVDTLLGDPSKAHKKLGWQPTSSLESLVYEMIEFDLREAQKNVYLSKAES